MARENGSSFSGACMGCFLGVLVVAGALGLYLYVQVPRWLEKADKGVIPYIESKGRALVGYIFLEPIFLAIDESDLSHALKNDWKTYVENKWELAYTSDDKKLSREDLINASRKVVASYSGCYYALKVIKSNGLENTTLTPKQQRKAIQLLNTTITNMESGVYSVRELSPLEDNIYSVMCEWRITTNNAKGKKERDINYRNLFRALNRLNKKAVHHGIGEPRNMKQEFLDELDRFQATVDAAEAEARAFFKDEKDREEKGAEPAVDLADN